jgi:hypothetical protein
MPDPKSSGPNNQLQAPQPKTRAEYDDAFARIAEVEEGSPPGQPEDGVHPAEAASLMQEAARDPTKVAALYKQGRSEDPETRARAAIALAGVRLERRAERAEQNGTGIARTSATARRNLRVLAASEQIRGTLAHGGEVPRVAKRRFWQFWRP